jgi:NADPH:quinone reductase-like Zn-dependent oxidoreductase
MSQMLALTSQPVAPYAQLTEVAEPRSLPNQALVETRAISLNRGECGRLETMEAGSITGWDVAGVVVAPATDGSGPPEGARVVGLHRSGGWAQRAAIETEWLAELPDGITFQQAATLPVAGMTALLSLEIGGFVLGRRVLVTGASGGVGRFGIQLAKLAGAHVTALARRTDGLRELGADDVLQELETEGDDFDVILDGVGGTVLGAGMQRVAARGTVVSFASTLTEPVSYPAREFFRRASGAKLVGFYLFAILDHTRSGSESLRRLAELVADGRIDPQIDVVRPWGEAGAAINALLGRRVAGKAVLTVS